MGENLRSGSPKKKTGKSLSSHDTNEYLAENDWRYQLISEVMADYIFVADVDPFGNLTLSWASDNMVLLTGRTVGEIMTPDLWKTVIYPDDVPAFLHFMKEMLTTTEKGELECRSFHKEGRERWIRISAHQKKGTDGKLTHIVGAVREITNQKQLEAQLKSTLEEKEALLREVHHRVRNNLQTVITLIQMRSSEIKDPASMRVLTQLQEQIRTISYIYDEMFQPVRLSSVTMQSYLELLISWLLKTFSHRNHIKMEVNCRDTVLEAKWAMPCGLIVNELVTNALKYAFPPETHDPLVIKVNLWKEMDMYFLQVSDNGSGLPNSLDLHNPSTIGMQLVNVWVKNQMNGMLYATVHHGTVYTITFLADNATN
jgi:PAS domain S-box-containing protein